MTKKRRVGLIGAGTIGGFVLDNVMAGKVDNAEIVVVCGRSEHSKGRDKVAEYGLPWITDAEELFNYDLDAVVEVASQEALEAIGEKILRAGIDLVPLSLGAFVDGNLLERLIAAATEGGSILHVASGGIGSLDALQAAVIFGVDKVTMTTRKPPEAWKNIPYVDAMKLDLDNMKEPYLLYEGPARDCVKIFPQNINIAAALSMAGIGFEKTIIRIFADPNVEYNTHEIYVEGKAGKYRITFENVPVASNPKTTYQACLSILASLKKLRNPFHMGT